MKRILLSLLVFFLGWFLLALGVSKPFLPLPVPVLGETLGLFTTGAILPHLGLSLFRVASALVLAFIPALLIGVAAGSHGKTDRLVTPMLYLLFPVPKSALLPIILLFFGLGNLSKIFLVALILFFQFFLSIRDEVHNLDRRHYDSLHTLGASRRDFLRHLILPAILPRIFSTLRLSLGTAIAVLFLAETFATRKGLGYFIMDAWGRLEYLEMYAGILTLSLVGLLLFLMVELAEKKFCPWVPRRNR